MMTGVDRADRRAALTSVNIRYQINNDFLIARHTETTSGLLSYHALCAAQAPGHLSRRPMTRSTASSGPDTSMQADLLSR